MALRFARTVLQTHAPRVRWCVEVVTARSIGQYQFSVNLLQSSDVDAVIAVWTQVAKLSRLHLLQKLIGRVHLQLYMRKPTVTQVCVPLKNVRHRLVVNQSVDCQSWITRVSTGSIFLIIIEYRAKFRPIHDAQVDLITGENYFLPRTINEDERVNSANTRNFDRT